MNKMSRLWLFFLSVMLLNVSYAGTIGAIQQSGTTVVTLNMGPAWTFPGTSQTFYLQPDIVNTYHAHNPSKAFLSSELFVGIQRPLYERVLGQLGLAIARSSQAVLQGDIWELADPTFDNFLYQYNLVHTHVAIKGKLITDAIGPIFQPYISGSLGVGFNRAHNYTITPKIVEAIASPAFQSGNTTSYVYTIGLGVQRAIRQHWQLSIGYEFSDWGKNSLSRAPGQTLNTGLKWNHFYTNQLQLGLSYVA